MNSKEKHTGRDQGDNRGKNRGGRGRRRGHIQYFGNKTNNKARK